MKLYSGIDRIHRELAAIGIDRQSPLKVADLTPFDQYHYHGTVAVDEAISAMGLKPGMRVLDIGAGLGGPARYMAETCGVHVTALELQEDLSAVGADLTRRCGLSHLVEHRAGNVLDGIDGEYDAIISMLCFLHIPDRERLLSVCRGALRRGSVLYVEDYGLHRDATLDERQALAVKVQCPYAPSIADYHSQLLRAGFADVTMEDVTADWTAFTSTRSAAYSNAHTRNVALHGEELVSGLEDFYTTVAGLFANGLIAGLKITAR